MKSHRTHVLIAILTLTIAAPCSAQVADQGAVNGTGVVSLSRPPEVMRMQVALTSKGATLKEALAALKTRTDTARTQVATLGCDKESIKIDAPRIAVQDPNNRNAMQMMMMQRMRGGNAKASTKSKTAPPVEVTATLTAEWKLSAKDPEAMLLFVHPLQEKIRAADLAGKSVAEKLTPEQEEMLEELKASGQSDFSMGGEAPPGTPDFLFVSKISEEERDQAMVQAFQKAQAEAAKLAKAAGSQLGDLRSVSSFGDPSGDYDDFRYSGVYGQNIYRLMQQANQLRQSGEGPLEAIGPDSSKVNYKVSLMVAYNLKSAK